MARAKVRIDSRGAREVLNSAGVRALVEAKTEEVASAVRAQGIQVEGVPGDVALPVEASMTTTDRAHGRVSIPHASGQAVQAKHGALSKAALEAGLEVRSK